MINLLIKCKASHFSRAGGDGDELCVRRPGDRPPDGVRVGRDVDRVARGLEGAVGRPCRLRQELQATLLQDGHDP